MAAKKTKKTSAKKTKKTGAKKTGAKKAPAKSDAKKNTSGSGDVIERVYRGDTYVVTKTADGTFEYDGKTYKSLTAVAKVITGADAISGPRFFGLA